MELTNDLTRSAILKQTLLSLCLSISYFDIGLVRGYSASAIPSMYESDPEMIPSKEIASWISSIPPFGAFFGSLVAAPIMFYAGRKCTVIIASPFWTAGWIIIAISQSWQTIFIGRLICGFCCGICLPSAQIYVTECSDPKVRGVIGSFPAIFMSAGVLVSYITGAFLPWHLLAWVNSICALTITLTVFFLPESPVWLRSKMRMEDAKKSIDWLQLNDEQTNNNNKHTNDIAIISNDDQIKNNMTQTSASSPDNNNDHSFKVLFSRPILLPLLTGLTLLAIQQTSGIDAIIFFTVEIFRSSGSSIDDHLATIIVGTVQLSANILSLFFVDRFGRRPLLIVSGVIMFLSTASMGSAFYLKNSGNDNFGYLPLLSLIIFMIGFSIGFGCIPFLLMGEIFPMAQRGLLSSLAGSFNLGVMFMVVKTYHPLEEVITTAGTFWMYSILCALGVIFVIFCVPETNGRDLDSIEKLFRKNSMKKSKITKSKSSPSDKLAVPCKCVSMTSINMENTKL